jgi:hypothetical protein
MAQVYIVGIDARTGARCWFIGMSEYLDQYNRPCQKPLFDDTEAKPVDTAFAQDAIARWGNNTLRITLEKYGPPIDGNYVEATNANRYVDRPKQFVPLTGGGLDGKGYFIHYSPERRKYYCRAIDVPSMIAEHRDRETLWADKPEDVVNKILELCGTTIAVPVEDPEAIARAAAQRQQEQEEIQRRKVPGNIRPGDRRR